MSALLNIAALIGIVIAASAADTDQSATVQVDFAVETVGARPVTVPPLVGEWMIVADGDRKKVLQVDGGHWRHDHLPESLDAAGTTLFADRGTDFVKCIHTRADYRRLESRGRL